MDYSSGQPVVLIFSSDEPLRKTRKWLLERDGYDVIPVATETEFRQRICEKQADLVVFCHTLTTAECERSVQFTEEHCPGARYLRLFAAQVTSQLPVDHVTLAISDGPEAFIQTVHKMLPLHAN
jgi:hypothetical protein